MAVGSLALIGLFLAPLNPKLCHILVTFIHNVKDFAEDNSLRERHNHELQHIMDSTYNLKSDQFL
jgi:hypothetical protein